MLPKWKFSQFLFIISINQSLRKATSLFWPPQRLACESVSVYAWLVGEFFCSPQLAKSAQRSKGHRALIIN